MVNTVRKIFSAVDWSYIAGLIDADGAIMASIEKHNEKKFGFRVRVVVKLSQKKPKVLEWLHSQTKWGYLRENHNTQEWVVKDQSQAKKLILNLQPYLKIKEKQADLALQILDLKVKSEQDLLHKAKLADTLASFNVRSRNRRKNYASKVQEYISRND